MIKKIFYSNKPVVSLSHNWKNYSLTQLTENADKIIKDFCVLRDIDLNLISLDIDGNVIVSFIETPSSSVRGGILLDLELELKNKLDVGVVVWHAALGDKNSLRKFRGIEVK